MAQLIGDVGGSSSRWAVMDGLGDPVLIDGLPGFNPATGDPTAFVGALRERFKGSSLENITVYGAGCGTPARKAIMEAALHEVFGGTAAMDIEADLLGAARGLYGSGSGMVLILGTGMNAGRFDGAVLHLPMPSLGYILGDEGSGADIGRVLVREALRGTLPGPVMHHVFPDGLELSEAIEHTYRSAAPQAWLASFAGRLAPLAADPEVQRIIGGRFNALADVLMRYFPPEKNAVIRATGGIAWGFGSLLTDVLSSRGYQLTAVERDPMPGLVKWHRAQP